MGILQVQNISLSFGERTILNNVSFTLGEHARAALAGGNGEGKTTLMKIIANLMHKDNGLVSMTKNMRISYLPQSDIVLRSNTVYEEIEKGFARYEQNLERQHEIENILKEDTLKEDTLKGEIKTDSPVPSNTTLLVELNNLQEELLDSTYYSRKAIIYEIAKGLGLSSHDLSRPCSEFSGGYQMRIALAKVLAEDPDLMMLDEPTNYLDIEARTWLKSYFKSYKGSLFLVCHDKGFMDDTVNEVYELFNAKLTRYSGNYSFYEKQRQLEIEQLEAAYKKQQDEIEKTEQFIERFRYKATKAKQVQSRVKMLDKLELVVVPSHLKTLHFSFPPAPHSPNDMVIIEGLNKTYNKNSSMEIQVFKDFSMTLGKGQRLAVTGHNGIGKSTLLRIIAGQDSDFTGVARLGTGVKVGYYAQDTADSLNMSNSIIEEVLPYGSEGQMRNALGAFLFSGDDIYKKINVLSGGERSRLALLKILLQPASLLILDEPTNHLDINSKDMLLKALKDYDGTIIFVSHDSYFIKGLANSILYLSEDKPQLFSGDYDYFEWKMSQRLGLEAKQKESKTSSTKSPDIQTENKKFLESFNLPRDKSLELSSKEERERNNKERNRINKLKKEVDALYAKIEDLEMKILEVKALMNLSENYSNAEKASNLASQLETLEIEKSKAEEDWMIKSEQLP